MSQWNAETVLVTGGAGFIGSHTVEALLERGSKVVVADDMSTGRMDNLAGVEDRITLERMDLTTGDVAGLLRSQDFDLVIHAAGNAYIPSSMERPERDLESNIVATHKLLAAMRSMERPPRLLNISSAAVYGEGSAVPIDESEPTRPVSPYGISKLAAELYVSLYSRLFGQKTCTVRLFSVFGPRLRKQVVWDFMNKLAANRDELAIQGDGGDMRDLNHIRNVVGAMLLVAEKSDMTGEVYNVAARESVTINDLAHTLASAMGLSPKIHQTGQGRPGHARSWKADIGKLERLGYEPSISYEDGIADTVAWFRATDHAS
ncbi:MAG TPA: GDP-mannose 4,6-dehydratase [Gemmatimonadaceae bacterium]|nr:GDP-mannose 4,6-dehydratase [Gemmatimonadaceae bacterium]